MTYDRVYRGPRRVQRLEEKIERRRCASCEQMRPAHELTPRRSKAHGVLHLCRVCELQLDSRGWLADSQ